MNENGCDHYLSQKYSLSITHWPECVFLQRYITLPSLAYDALLRMLQKEGQEIELIYDEQIYRFVQKALRVSYCTFLLLLHQPFLQGGLCQVLSRRLHAGPGSEELLKMIAPALKVCTVSKIFMRKKTHHFVKNLTPLSGLLDRRRCIAPRSDK